MRARREYEQAVVSNPMLAHKHRNVGEHVECLPGALPDPIEVDASPLTIGQGMKEIAKSEGVRYLDDPDQKVVSVAVPMSDAKLETALTSQAAGPGAKNRKVIAKGKAEVEGAEGVAAAPGAAAPAARGEAKRSRTIG